MAAEPNIGGMARLLFLLTGTAAAAWALWGADPGWTRWAWLVLGGVILTLGLIGYSPVHAMFGSNDQKVS